LASSDIITEGSRDYLPAYRFFLLAVGMKVGMKALTPAVPTTFPEASSAWIEAIGDPSGAGRRALVRARVGDGAVSYTLALALVRRSGRWLVDAVGGE
jgi:hypothetical protein